MKKFLTLTLILFLSSYATAHPFNLDHAQAGARRSIRLMGSVANATKNNAHELGSYLLKRYHALSPDTRQVISFSLLIPAIYSLFSTVTSDAQSQSKDNAEIVYRKAAILLSGVAIGIVMKMALDSIADGKLDAVKLMLKTKDAGVRVLEPVVDNQ